MLAGWLLRDGLITGALGLLLWLLQRWHEATGTAAAAAAGAILGFVAAYVLCYIYHEWGHLIGAHLARASMPLNPYRGALIGRFDIKAHSPEQFLSLSWGGVAAYTGLMTAFVLCYALGLGGWPGAGLAVGGLAFVTQSWAVDLPQIRRVQQGEDPLTVNRHGASPEVILRRTWQMWVPLLITLLGWNLLASD